MIENKQPFGNTDYQWQDLFQDLHIKDNPCLSNLFQFRDKQTIDDFNSKKLLSKSQTPFYQDQQLPTLPSQMEQEKIRYQQDKRQGSLFEKSNSSQQTQKLSKYHGSDKQRFYAKAYRQKVKQKYKNLEQQNVYLKNRVTRLQERLRTQQIQLCRFKYGSANKQQKTNDLNVQWIEEVRQIIQTTQLNPLEFYQLPSEYQPHKSVFIQKMVKFYDKRGFAGQKKLQILNYHFNQVLQNILKDSQKYLSLVFANSKAFNQPQPLPEFQPINNMFKDLFKPNGDLWSRLSQFGKFLHPMLIQFNSLISKFYKTYQQILCYSKRIHNLLRETFANNVNVAGLRYQVEKFFEFHKYGKMMRRLRYDWFVWMRSLSQKEQQQKKPSKKGYKKKFQS